MLSWLSRGGCKIDIFRASDPFRCKLKCPCDHERDWKSDHDNEHDQSDGPIRNVEDRENLRDALSERPAGDSIGDGDLINIAPLQLGEEVVNLHSLTSWLRFKRRGISEII